MIFSHGDLRRVPSSLRRFVDHVPAADAALVAADDGADVILHALEQCVAGERLAFVVLEDPPRRLAVPDQRCGRR